jgi:hypothetical protein
VGPVCGAPLILKVRVPSRRDHFYADPAGQVVPPRRGSFSPSIPPGEKRIPTPPGMLSTPRVLFRPRGQSRGEDDRVPSHSSPSPVRFGWERAGVRGQVRRPWTLDIGPRLRRIFDFGLTACRSLPSARTKPLATRSALSIQPQNRDSSKISFRGIRD